jgi:hypothetical protein
MKYARNNKNIFIYNANSLYYLFVFLYPKHFRRELQDLFRETTPLRIAESHIIIETRY